jgi:hypothetical protein
VGVSNSRRHEAGKPGGSATIAEQEKCNDLEKAIASAAAVAGIPVPNLSSDFQPLSFEKYVVPRVSTFVFLEKLSIHIAGLAYGSPGAALRRLFGLSVSVLGPTKLLPYWHDNG